MDDGCGACGSTPADDGVCTACRECPPLASRGGRLGPLALGLLSIPFGMAVLPSVLAIRRGLQDLGEVARRERVGLWREEHERVRDRAVLGIMLGSVVPILALAYAASWMSSFPDEGVVAYARAADDELGEVLAYFAEDKHVHYECARSQLEALAPGMADSGFDRALARAATIPEGWAILHALMADDARQERVLPRLPRVFGQMPMREQETLLDATARSTAPGAMTTLAALANGPLNHMSKPRPNGVVVLRHSLARPPYARLPFAPLAAREDAADVLRPLLQQRDHEYFGAALDVATAWCRTGRAREALRSLEPTYVQAVSAARCQRVLDELGAPIGRACGGEALVALGCMEGEASAALLRDGLHPAGTPELVIEAWLLRGEEVSDATIASVARRADRRGALYRALARCGEEDRFPAELRTPLELARAEIADRCAGEPRLRAERESRIRNLDAHFFVLECDADVEEDEPFRTQFVVGPVVTRGASPCETELTQHIPTDRGELFGALLAGAVSACRREVER